MTPEELRALANRPLGARIARGNELVSAADAWERDIAERDSLRKRVEELETKLSRCGQENCMGWRDGDRCTWVREERFLEVQRRLKEMQGIGLSWAIARGWSHEKNAHKELDVDLAVAIEAEVRRALEAP